jgi:hypothetical protein
MLGRPQLYIRHSQRSLSDSLRCAAATAVQERYIGLVPDTDITELIAEGMPAPLAAVKVYVDLAAWASTRGHRMRLHYPPPWGERLWVGVGRHATYPRRRAVVFSGRAVVHDPGAEARLPPVTRVDFGITFDAESQMSAADQSNAV